VPRYRVSVIAVAARNKGLDLRQGEVLAGSGFIHGRRGSGSHWKLHRSCSLEPVLDQRAESAVPASSLQSASGAMRLGAGGWQPSLESRPRSEARPEGEEAGQCRAPDGAERRWTGQRRDFTRSLS